MIKLSTARFLLPVLFFGLFSPGITGRALPLLEFSALRRWFRKRWASLTLLSTIPGLPQRDGRYGVHWCPMDGTSRHLVMATKPRGVRERTRIRPSSFRTMQKYRASPCPRALMDCFLSLNFKKALSMDPPANVKANSEKYLKQMGSS